MFPWGRKAERPDSSTSVIEMKGSKPEPQTSRLQWKGIWPSWEDSLRESEGTVRQNNWLSPRQTRGRTILEAPTPTLPESLITRDRCSSDSPECVSSNVQAVHGAHQAAEPVVSPIADGNSEQEDAEFYEVKMVIKVPKPKQMSHKESAQELIMEELRAELEKQQEECQRVVRTLKTKSQECEDLLALVRELTESRSQLTAFKAIQTERFEDLQQEYLRILRIVELSRAISKENLAKTAQTMSKLNQVEEELARQRLITQQTKDRLARQKVDNLDLKDRLNMLERMDLLAFRRESACMIRFQQLGVKETY